MSRLYVQPSAGPRPTLAIPRLIVACNKQTQKDLPSQFFASSKPLHATVVIGSFGSSQALVADAFDIDVKQDTLVPPPTVPESLRYGKRPQIHHIFREDTKFAPSFLAVVFMIAVGATLPLFLAAVSCLEFLLCRHRSMLLTPPPVVRYLRRQPEPPSQGLRCRSPIARDLPRLHLRH